MAKRKDGKNLVLYLGERGSGESGHRVAFQSEHSIDATWNKDLITTKDGNEQVGGSNERTISATFYDYYSEDGSLSITERLEQWGDDGTELNIWELDVTKVTGGEVEIPQFIGVLDSLSQPRPAEGGIEVTADFTILEKVVGTETLGEEFAKAISETQREYESIQQDGQ